MLRVFDKTEGWSTKVNFVDSNNNVLGYDMSHQCCEYATWSIVIDGETMGTTYAVKIVGSPLTARELRRLSADIQAELSELNRQMSTYLPDSEISRFNAWRNTRPGQRGRFRTASCRMNRAPGHAIV